MKCHVLLSAILLTAISVAGRATGPVELTMWSQQPDLDNGMAYSSGTSNYYSTADDWLCQSNDPITEIRWWGSYWSSAYPTPDSGAFADSPSGGMTGFKFQILSDVPRGQDKYSPFNHPGNAIWQYTSTTRQGSAPAFTETLLGTTTTGRKVYEYSIKLPEAIWFRPKQGGVFYWLTLSPTMSFQGRQWGWQESGDHWTDSAAVQQSSAKQWYVLLNNPNPVNMAFELVSNPVPEPGSMFALATGVVGLAGLAAKRRGARK